MIQQSILVVNDEAPMSKLLASNLKATGYTVRTAADSAEAMKLMEEHTLAGARHSDVKQHVFQRREHCERRGAELPIFQQIERTAASTWRPVLPVDHAPSAPPRFFRMDIEIMGKLTRLLRVREARISQLRQDFINLLLEYGVVHADLSWKELSYAYRR